MQIIHAFKHYLLSTGIAETTTRGYIYDINDFKHFITKRYHNETEITDETWFLQQLTSAQFHETDLLAYFSHLEQNKHNSDAAIRRKFSALHRFFSFLITQGLLTQNYCSAVSMQKRYYPPKPILLPTQLTQLLTYVETTCTLRDQLLLFLILFYGCTIQEVCALKIANVHEPHLFIYKNDSCKRDLLLSDALISILSRFLNENRAIHRENLFYSKQARTLSVRMAKMIVQKALSQSGIYTPKMNTNILRNTCAYLYTTYKQYTLKKLQIFFGHKNITTTALLVDFEEIYMGETDKKTERIVAKYLSPC